MRSSLLPAVLLSLPFLSAAELDGPLVLPYVASTPIEIKVDNLVARCFDSRLNLTQDQCASFTSSGTGGILLNEREDPAYVSYITNGQGLVVDFQDRQPDLVWKWTAGQPEDDGTFDGRCLGPVPGEDGDDCVYGPDFRRGPDNHIVDAREQGKEGDDVIFQLSVQGSTR